MPKGTERTIGLIVPLVENDAEMASIMDLETATAYFEVVPASFSYPFILITEEKDAYSDRNSETIGGDPTTAFHNEFRKVSIAACSNSGDMAWDMIDRFRNKFVETTPSKIIPLSEVGFSNTDSYIDSDGLHQQGGLAVAGTVTPTPVATPPLGVVLVPIVSPGMDDFDIQCLPESIQILQNTHIKDDTGREVWSSMQKFMFIACKRGSN